MFLFRWIILRPMRRDLGRAILTVFGVAVGVAAMLGIQKANEASLAGFRAALNATSGRAALELVAPPLGVAEGLFAKLPWLREYGVASPVMEVDALAETVVGGQEMLRVLAIDVLRDPALRDYPVAEEAGEGPAAGMELMALLGERDRILVTAEFAEKHGVGVGSKLDLTLGDRLEVFEVAAVMGGEVGGTGGVRLRGSFGVVDIAVAQALLERQGRVDRIDVRLREGLAVAAVEGELRERLEAEGIEGVTVQRPERRGEAVEKMLAAFHFNLSMLSMIALVVGLFLIYNTISVAVMTRRAEIGMLRTLGVKRLGILGLFLGEAVLLGLLGAGLGVPLAQGLAQGAVALTSTTVDTLYVAQAAVVPAFQWMDGVMALAVAVPLALVAAARPAWEAVGVAPVAAVTGRDATAAAGGRLRWRYLLGPGGCLAAGLWCGAQPAVGGLPLFGYAATLLAVAGMAFAAPGVLVLAAGAVRGVLGWVFGIEGRLAASQVRASTGRLSVSVAALAVSLALTTAIAIMVGSFRQTVVLWVEQSMGADLYVRPAVPPRSTDAPTFRAETTKRLAAHPGVAAVDGYRAMDLPYEGRLVKLGAGDFRLQRERGKLALKTRAEVGEILRRALVERQVLVSEAFAMRFGKVEGDVVRLSTPRGVRELVIAAQFYDYSNDRGTITMDQALFADLFGESNPTHLALYLEEGVDAERVKGELVAAMSGLRVLFFTNAGLREEVLRIFDSTFAITWALEVIAILVAMAGVAATMTTLILERRGEIRLLRLAGAEASQVRRTILIESALIGAVSQGLGLVVGWLMSLVLIRVINPQSFGWSIQFHLPWAFLLGASVLTVAATMVAGLVPAWRATRGGYADGGRGATL